MDAIPTDQQLIVQSQSEFSQTQTLLQREVQSLYTGSEERKNNSCISSQKKKVIISYPLYASII